MPTTSDLAEPPRILMVRRNSYYRPPLQFEVYRLDAQGQFRLDVISRGEFPAARTLAGQFRHRGWSVLVGPEVHL